MKDRSRSRRMTAGFLQRPRDPVLALYAGEAAYLAGDEEVAVALWSIGDDLDPQMLRLENDARAPDEARKISAIANRAFKRHFTSLHARAVEEFEARTGSPAPRVRASVWPLTHDGPVEFQTPMQEPVIFYMPDLPAAPFEPRDKFPWADALERAWPEILEEYEAARTRNAVHSPYVPAETREAKWSKLRGDEDWSAIHLFKEARRTEFANLFPRTINALSVVDLVSIKGVPLEVFFSRLRPGAHIPPHFGLTNTRVTVHLPLIAPKDCEIRVGDAFHRWRPGELVALDDSYEHEAWNRSASDRVVLIFEAPHPDLSPIEREAIEWTYGVRQDWLTGRVRLLTNYVRANRLA